MYITCVEPSWWQILSATCPCTCPHPGLLSHPLPALSVAASALGRPQASFSPYLSEYMELIAPQQGTPVFAETLLFAPQDFILQNQMGEREIEE